MLRLGLLILVLLSNSFSLSETTLEKQNKLEKLMAQKKAASEILPLNSAKAEVETKITTSYNIPLNESNLELQKQPELKEVFSTLATLNSVEPNLIQSDLLDNITTFGYDFFDNQLSQANYQNLALDVPDNYIFGQGDSLLIHVWNQTIDETLRVEVNQKGMIPFPLAGEILVSGIEYVNLTDYLKKQLSSFYSAVNLTIQVEKLRQFPVYVTGEVKRPGMHLVNSLATPLQLLILAGGPKNNGSLRQIKLIRATKLYKTIDLQRFLSEGYFDSEIKLKPLDVIHIPLAAKKIAMLGSLKRSAIYELLDNETLLDALNLTGGLRSDAKNLQWLSFNQEGNLVIKDLKLSDLKNIIPSDGSSLIALTSQKTIQNKVSITGNVYTTGTFEWHNGLTIKELINKASGIKPMTSLDSVRIERIIKTPENIANFQDLNLKTQKQTIYLNLADELSGKSKSKLFSLDEIYVFSLEEVQISPTIEIRGEVLKPGNYDLQKDTHLKDILIKAQLSNKAHLLVGEVTRQTKDGVKVLNFVVKAALDGVKADNLVLRHQDLITIFADPRVINQGSISLSGEVKYPGTYRFNNGDRLVDILKRAGGFSNNAFLLGSAFYRESIKNRQIETRDVFVKKEKENLNNLKISTADINQNQSAAEKAASMQAIDEIDTVLDKLSNTTIEGRLAMNFRGLDSLDLIEQSINNIVLEDNDRFHIPTKPSEISIIGQVYAPTTVLYQEGYQFEDYINVAGGFSDNAYKNKIFLLKANGQALPISQLNKKPSNRYVESIRANDLNNFETKDSIEVGDTIVVPTKIVIRQNRMKDTLDMIYKTAISVGALNGIFK